MKSQIFLKGIISLVVISTPLFVWSATGSVTSSWTTAKTETTALLLSGITILDDAHIQMDFTQNIVVESVRLRIAKQSDGMNIKVESLTGVVNLPTSVSVSLVDLLEAWETYTMTLISALSDKWITITEWTDALSEFKAPDPLKQSMVVFDAAPNPEAAIVKEEPTPTETKDETEKASPIETTTAPIPEDTELPLTGMNPLYFIFISWFLALGLILRKQS